MDGVQVPTHPDGWATPGQLRRGNRKPGGEARLSHPRSERAALGGSARPAASGSASEKWVVLARPAPGPEAPKGLTHLGRRPSRPLLRPPGKEKPGRGPALRRPRPPGPCPRLPSPSCEPRAATRAPLLCSPGPGRHVSGVSGDRGRGGAVGLGGGDPGLPLSRRPRGKGTPESPGGFPGAGDAARGVRGWEQFPRDRRAGAAVAGDARQRAAPGPAGRRPGTWSPCAHSYPQALQRLGDPGPLPSVAFLPPFPFSPLPEGFLPQTERERTAQVKPAWPHPPSPGVTLLG